jgi:predicted ribosome quality control (RQC) complex YloA/Tae2 family protein
MVGPLTEVRWVGDDRVVEFVFPGGLLHCRLFRGGGIWWVEGGEAVAAIDGPCAPELPALTPTTPNDAGPRFTPEEGQGWLAAAGAWHANEVARAQAQRWLAHLRTDLRRRLERERRLQANLMRDLEAADKAPALRADADGLAAVLHAIPRGAATVEVPDFSTGGTLTVRVDPAQPVSVSLKRLYDRAGRLDRAGAHILERCVRCEGEVARLEGALAAALAADPDEARGLAAQFGVGAPPVSARIEQVRAKPWATWRGPHGAEVWVGRSAEGNRQLVFRHARGRDLWLHLRERPGAHAVVPAASARSSAVVDAAVQLLLRAARAEAGELLEVQMARVADVRPRPGGGPGDVVVHHERVRAARCAPDALAGWTAEDPPRRG